MHPDRNPLLGRLAEAALLGLLAVAVAGYAAPAALAASAAPAPGQGASSAASRPASAVTVDQVLGHLRKTLTSAQAVRLKLTATQFDAQGRESRSVLQISAMRQPPVTRIEFLEPDAFADQVIVVDQPAKTVKVYLPVTHQILVQPLEQMAPAGEPGQFAFDLLPSEDVVDYRLQGTETEGGTLYYVLEVKPKAGGTGGAGETGGAAGSPAGGLAQLFGTHMGTPVTTRLWVDGRRWVPGRLELYDATGRLAARVALSAVEVNPNLKAADLLALPEDAEVVEG